MFYDPIFWLTFNFIHDWMSNTCGAPCDFALDAISTFVDIVGHKGQCTTDFVMQCSYSLNFPHSKKRQVCKKFRMSKCDQLGFES